MRSRLRLAPSVLVPFVISCAGATELSSAEGEAEPPVTAAAAEVIDAPPASAHVRPRPAPEPAVPAVPVGGTDPMHPFDSRYADEVRSVVSLYESWGRVDDEARWAPGLCRMPRAASAHVSQSDDPKTHGHKLYTLYAMDPAAYGAPASDWRSTPMEGLSQVIVKESFSPVLFDDDMKVGRLPSGGVGAHHLRPALRDGQRFMAGERKGLYLMMKTNRDTKGTDAGWIYATVAADLVTITAVGVIDSCAGCHAEAGDGRLFGLPNPVDGIVVPKDNAKGPPL